MFRGLALVAILSFVATGTRGGPLDDGAAAEKAGRFPEALRHYTAALQATSEGSAGEAELFRKAIGVAAKLRKLPAPPDEVLRHEGRAEAAVRGARSEQDFLNAAAEFRRAARLAPWVASYYYNMGLVYEKAGRTRDARQAYELYLLAAPNARDARDVQRKIAGLEYQHEQAAREREDQARRAAAEQARREAAERREQTKRQDKARVFAALSGTRWNQYCEGSHLILEARVVGERLDFRKWEHGSWFRWSAEHGVFFVFDEKTGQAVRNVDPNHFDYTNQLIKRETITINSPAHLIRVHEYLNGARTACNLVPYR
jgi:tetratricopeptide (TPR) repeat protein